MVAGGTGQKTRIRYGELVTLCPFAGKDIKTVSSFSCEMGFKIGGLDDIQRFLDDYKKGLEHQTFDEWANRVTQTAKELCSDPDCKRIKLQQKQQQDTGNLSLNFEFADKEAIDCMLKAIDQLQESMPPSLQQIYEAIKPQLEAKKAGF